MEQNELTINLLGKQAYVNHKPLPLTRKEFDLLVYFINNRNKVISKVALAEHIYDELTATFDSYDFM